MLAHSSRQFYNEVKNKFCSVLITWNVGPLSRLRLKFGFLLSAQATLFFLLYIVDPIISWTLVAALYSSSPCIARYQLPDDSMYVVSKVSLCYNVIPFLHIPSSPHKIHTKNQYLCRENCFASQVCYPAQLCNKISWFIRWDQNSGQNIFGILSVSERYSALYISFAVIMYEINPTYHKEYHSLPFSWWSSLWICWVWELS